MNEITITYYKSPVGELILGSFENQLCLCDWRYRKMRNEIDQRILKGLNAEFAEGESKIIYNTINQLNEYFEKQRTDFDIPLKLIGTDFQKGVWNELKNISFGKTETYLSFSRKLGKEKAIRAVASANGANAISIIIPCHRIIGSNGEMIGYAGGLAAKRKLLQLESKNPNTEQLNLF
jgi:methylated-DNA-[protein]-cysteine S-methyltransferase